MRHPLALLLAAALALAACGQPFLSAEVEVPKIRIVKPPEYFPALPADPESVCSTIRVPHCTAQTYSFDLGTELDQKGVTTELRLTALAFRFTSGDTRGVRHAEVDVLDPQTGVTTLVASYDRTSLLARPAEIGCETSNVDLAPFLKSGKVDARVEVLLDPAFLPTGFTSAIDATFSAKLTVDYRKL